MICRREACTVFQRGAFVSIRRAPFDAAQFAELRHAIESVATSYPRTVSLLAFRLERAFPVAEHDLTDVHEFVKTLRAIDRHLAAQAIVLEFGGVRAAAMRALGRTVTRIVRPRGAIAFHDRLTEAATWLVPYARGVGAPDDLGEYVRSYREADRLLGP
jgi:hypothetical protein